MKKRQIIIVTAAILIIVIGKLGMDALAQPKERVKPEDSLRIVTVFADEVKLAEQSIEVATTGNLQAKDRMELYSEVQGLMLPDEGRFKAGNSFKKGAVLLSMRSDDAHAKVVSQRSAFERILSSVMADIRLDYPTDFQAWSSYLEGIDVNTALAELPEIKNAKLKNYLTGRDVFTSYYNVRNAEIGLSRFQLRAPFDGVLTTANVNPGTVIRPNQLLGVFLKPGIYELQSATDQRTAERLAKGQLVKLTLDGNPSKQYEGRIARVNASINAATQMSEFFVDVRAEDLKDGQFMNVTVDARTISDAYELERSALKDSKYAYVVQDDKLKLRELEVLHTSDRTAIVRGLKNGELVLSKLPPTAFEGMQVTIYSEDTAE